MRALTVHNPYAHLIVTPQEELPDGAFNKRVENRKWKTNVRGELAIHAGVSMDWFHQCDYPIPDEYKWTTKVMKPSDFPMMAFGAIVGVCDLVGCFSVEEAARCDPDDLYGWVYEHIHSVGPYCFVLDNVRRLQTPVPCTGKQGFWTVNSDVECLIRKQLEGG